MRILMTADTVGGVWSYAMELVAQLGARGATVTIAAMGAPASRAQRRRAQTIPGARLCEAPYRLEWMRDPWEDIERAGQWLLALEREVEPDVVHLNTYPHGDLAFRAPVLLVCHACVHSWWRAVHGREPPAEWSTYAHRVARGLRAADLVVAPTRAMLDEAVSLYAVGGPTRVIPNGVDRSPYGRGEPEPMVLSTGRLWDEAKNLAAVDAASCGLDWPVYVAGPANHSDGGEIAPSRAILLGSRSREEVQGWMARAAIYALPARYEPFGLSALEAALSGCALVLGDIPTLRELWDGAAIFVDPGDPAALHHELQALIRRPERRAEFAARARRRARTLDATTMAAGYLRAYRELAAAPAARHEEGRTT